MKYFSPTDVSKTLGTSLYKFNKMVCKGTIPYPTRICPKSLKLWYNQSDVSKIKRTLKNHSNGFKGPGYYWIQRCKHPEVVWMQEPSKYYRAGSQLSYAVKADQWVIGPIKPKKVKS